MSCPHVSGLAALLRKAYWEWTPAAIKSALMTTVYNLYSTRRNFTDLATGDISTPFIHGARHVDPNREHLILDHPVDCSALGLGSPGDLNYPSFSVVFDSSKSVVKYKRTVKNVGSSADVVYHVMVSAPQTVGINVSPEKLLLVRELKRYLTRLSLQVWWHWMSLVLLHRDLDQSSGPMVSTFWTGR
ncbi:hypothetical protein RHSIM_Rhsim01G0228700 [Rhododendron simsii]|uniref:Uncharacterized protein n=1 Tax=Rhododendron simsii TaxID=118357 RepID=A0A834HK98_RHOSS|nr:hypothetical protein RHSIM_Rhsim01G0228700 [Rhododendron simsii]